jgi:hypothetical protein
LLSDKRVVRELEILEDQLTAGGADRRTLFLVTVALKPGSVRTGAAGSPALVRQLYAGETTGYVETLSVEVPGVGRP